MIVIFATDPSSRKRRAVKKALLCTETHHRIRNAFQKAGSGEGHPNRNKVPSHGELLLKAAPHE